MPIDGGFICGYKVTKNYRFMGQDLVDTKGKVVAECDYNTYGILYSLYNSRGVSLGHDFYIESSIPVNQVWFISSKFSGICNTVKTDTFRREVTIYPESETEYKHEFPILV